MASIQARPIPYLDTAQPCQPPLSTLVPEELGDVLQVGGDVFEVGRAAGDAVPVRAGVAGPQDEV